MAVNNKSEFRDLTLSVFNSTETREEENIMQLISLNNTVQGDFNMEAGLLNGFNLMDEFYNQRIFNKSHHESGHFSLLNVKSCSLISKSKLKQKLAQENPSEWDSTKLTKNDETNRTTGLNKYIFGCKRPKPTSLATNKVVDTSLVSTSGQDCSEPCKKHTKPPKKKKKLPYLDKKIRRGYLKFFDAKNNFGFMKLLDPPKSDIFVFGREFVKSDFSQELLHHANGNPNVVFNFRTIHYEGKHGESKKAVEMTLEGMY